MIAAKRNHKITIQRKTTTLVECVEQETFTTVKSLWASVEHRNPSERWANGRMNPDVTDIFNASYSSGITSEMRVSYGGKIYEIIGVEDIRDEHRDMIIQAKELI